MNSDADLLRCYLDEHSEAAFAELVRLHLALVYFAALRQLGGDAHRAREVTQSVFTDLARKARSLRGRETLTGWLHTSTRFAVLSLRRAEATRRKYEEEAEAMKTLQSDETGMQWEQVRHLIDEVVYNLDERDREAVLPRFFEARTFGEIGASLRLTEDAARMRVERALEKLRVLLSRRGVTSTSAALGVTLGQQAGLAAPAGLAVAVSGSALAATSVAPAWGLLKFMSTTKFVAGAAGLSLALALALVTRERQNHRAASLSLLAARSEATAMAAQLAEAQRQAQLAETSRAEIEQAVADARTKQTARDAQLAASAARARDPAIVGQEFLAAHPKALQ